MSRVFITGSSDGLGLLAGRLLAADGHPSRCTPAIRAGPMTPARRCWRRMAPGGRRGHRGPVQHRRDAAGRGRGQRVRPLRRGHPQRRDRVPGAAAGRDRRRPRPGLRGQRAGPVPADGPDRTARPAGLPELGHARPRDAAWTMRNGNADAGTERRPTPTASCSTRCSPSPSRGGGPACCPTRSTPAGCRPRWGGPAPWATCPWPRSRRPGWRSAPTREPWSAAATSTTSRRGKRIPPPGRQGPGRTAQLLRGTHRGGAAPVSAGAGGHVLVIGVDGVPVSTWSAPDRSRRSERGRSASGRSGPQAIGPDGDQAPDAGRAAGPRRSRLVPGQP